MFIAKDVIDEKVVDVAAGYSGSSKDHVYWPKEASREAYKTCIAAKGLADSHHV